MPTTLHTTSGNFIFLSPGEKKPEGSSPLAFLDSRMAATLLLQGLHDPFTRAEIFRLLTRDGPSFTSHPPSDAALADQLGRMIADGRIQVARGENATAATGGSAPPTSAPPPPPPPPAKKSAATASSSAAAPVPVEIKTFKVVKLEFTTDHNKLKDNRKDWKNTGQRLPKPEWTAEGANHPISQTRNVHVGILLTFDVGPASAPSQEVELAGKGPAWLTFGDTITVQPGVQKIVRLECKTPLPDEVEKLSGKIEWTLKSKTGKPISGGTTGPHTIYCTAGIPIDRDQNYKLQIGGEGKVWEDFNGDGVTIKRMEKAIELYRKAMDKKNISGLDYLVNKPASDGGTPPPLDPSQYIVFGLQSMVPDYTLTPNKAIPKDHNHPKYWNDIGGAWAITDSIGKGFKAECQAIIRFIKGIIRQVGLSGTAELALVYRDPITGSAEEDVAEIQPRRDKTPIAPASTPKPNAEVPTGILKDPTDPPGVAKYYKIIKGKECRASHPDKKATVRAYPPTDAAPGFNAFEACLKFTDNSGKTLYFEGGGKVKVNKEGVGLPYSQVAWVWMEYLPEDADKPTELKRLKMIHVEEIYNFP